MRLSFLGAASEVTGSNHLLEFNNQKILLDCGLFQGSEELQEKNFESFDFDPQSITAVILSHAHLDHCGRIPKLVKEGFRGKIYCTAPTKKIAAIVLNDAASLMEEESKDNQYNPKKKPALYTVQDAARAISFFETIEYDKPFNVGDANIILKDAGHILGSAFIQIKYKENRLAFSGDLGNNPVPLLDAPDDLDQQIQYLLTESTYGNRLHDNSKSRKEYLLEAIDYIRNHGGTLMIPAFALERTQEILYELNDLVENGTVEKMPIFLDSPMAIDVTEVFRKYHNYLNQESQNDIKNGDDIFSFKGLTLADTREQSIAINQVRGPKIIIAGSGMLNGGRIVHHLQRYLSDSGSVLMFAGYQVEGTLGRRILDGEKKIKIFDDWMSVKAKIIDAQIFSAHADRKQVLEWIAPAYNSLKKIYLVHGEREAAIDLKSALGAKTKAEIMIPDLDSFDELD